MAASLFCVGSAAAYREAKKLTQNLGEQLTGKLGVLGGDMEQVLVNGEEFSFGALVVKGDAQEVLGAIEEDCKSHSGDLAEQFALAHKIPGVAAAVPDLDLNALTTLRRDLGTEQGGHTGDVLCALRDNGADDAGILDRLKSFAQSGNFSDLGNMRYVRADSRPGSDKTRVLAIWTESKLNLEKMFAAEGDAPGSDPPSVARPPSSRRLFSGFVPRSGDGVYAYESRVSPRVVLDFYAESLAREHYLPVRLAFADQSVPADASAFVRGGRAVVVYASRASTQVPTDVGVVLLEARRVASATAVQPRE